MEAALLGLITIVVGVGGCLAYFYLSNQFLDHVLFPAKGENAGRNINRANMIRPWLFLAPALIALGLYLAYPVVATLWYSVTERQTINGESVNVFVGFANYSQMFGEEKFWEAMRNNMLWLIIVPAASTAFGLLVAQLTDRIAWGSIAKALIFMPMAISFVGAAVIFKLIYDTRPVDQAQIGVMNAVWLQFEGGSGSFIFLRLIPGLLMFSAAGAALFVGYSLFRSIMEKGGVVLRGLAILILVIIAIQFVRLGIGAFTAVHPYGEPQQWLTIPGWNSFLLMVVLIWIQTGFAMVILSAALRGIPEETIEAAIVDGANPFQVFFKIKMPQIAGTIVVVWTTITLVVLKVFDIVFAMTNGQWETQVLANYMFDKLFRANDWGVGSASAMIIMLLVSPILIWNVYNARKEMK
ncbi:carbohydrate ABC transporter membrane protein 1, CUT1 family [Cognatiyoonia koreensis]|uniref:Carbohydrate ABC transporter membrane protein 1, CUT1 family n=1 Tax=Cognatiyoonia koreensis TaxID=364200 RepID=A0A1I0PHQ2_9RHOB|nr:sugar ABC transporter permease [Cognatiyoonia koreensis]SEW13247.1 carbohydrate ABC transporter membrane protein 1, CUT1 family [Cognatiyoonia koreensis]